jgi:hypothetical protein
MVSRYRPQRNWGARIHEVERLGMRVVTLENATLRVSLLAGKGTDVIECNYKPRDLDYVWLTAGGVRNPLDHLHSSLDPEATFLDHYPGGWQEIFPNGGGHVVYRDAQIGMHGEVSTLPWDYQIVEDREEAVVVTFRVRPYKLPCLLEKTVSLDASSPRLIFSERLVNESDVPLDVMWGHHITFGRPFLHEGAHIALPPGLTAIPHATETAPHGRLLRSATFAWPHAEQADGTPIDMSVLPPRGTPSEMLYLSGFAEEGWYEVHSNERTPAFRVSWDARQMPYLWYWGEYGANDHFPFWGRHYNIGLEPFSSFPDGGLPLAVKNGRALHLAPREERAFTLRATVKDVL